MSSESQRHRSPPIALECLRWQATWLFGQQFHRKKSWKFHNSALCEEGTCDQRLLSQRVSYAENLSMSWRHHDISAKQIITYRVNTSRPRQNGGHFPDDVFKCIFLNENAWKSIKISLKFVPKGLINNIPALIQRMAWRRPGDKPLSEPNDG